MVKELSTLVLIVIMTAQAVGDEWTTTDGKIYNKVKVVKVEDDAVTIIYDEGGALIPLNKLPANLQQKFHYDPVKAKIAADARTKADAENAVALQKEIDQAQQLKRQKQINDANQRSDTPTATTTP